MKKYDLNTTNKEINRREALGKLISIPVILGGAFIAGCTYHGSARVEFGASGRAGGGGSSNQSSNSSASASEENKDNAGGGSTSSPPPRGGGIQQR